MYERIDAEDLEETTQNCYFLCEVIHLVQTRGRRSTTANPPAPKRGATVYPPVAANVYGPHIPAVILQAITNLSILFSHCPGLRPSLLPSPAI